MSGECVKCGEHCLECSCHHQSWGTHISVDISHIPKPPKTNFKKYLQIYEDFCEPNCCCKKKYWFDQEFDES